MLDNKELQHLRQMAAVIRSNIIEMIPPGKVGHLGGSSSVADILSVLYFHRMRGLDPASPHNPDRDRLVFSKGHAVLAQYAALVELSYFPRSELKKVKTLDGLLQGHPDIDRTPGIEAVTGSLGQGLSICCGMAMALRLDKSPAKVFCIAGDGKDIIGIAGASGTSVDSFWEVGVDVREKYRGEGLGTYLVSRLTDELMERDIVPFYSASVTNIGSQRTAHRSGYIPMWVDTFGTILDGSSVYDYIVGRIKY